MTRIPDCPVCQASAPWQSKSSNKTYRYKGQEFTLNDSEYSECRECGFDVVLPRQKRRNEARIRDEHRRIDGLLTGEQIRTIRQRLQFTQAQLALLIGGGANAFSKYERGEVIQSAAMNSLLLLLDAMPMPDAREMLQGLAARRLVRSEQLSQPTSIPAPVIVTQRLEATRLVSVSRAREYRRQVDRQAA
jgi:HTH-type transcriptional regulator/antitoxin MqsA